MPHDFPFPQSEFLQADQASKRVLPISHSFSTKYKFLLNAISILRHNKEALLVLEHVFIVNYEDNSCLNMSGTERDSLYKAKW